MMQSNSPVAALDAAAHRRRAGRGRLAHAVCAALVVAPGAMESARAAETGTLEEVVVTANRREESLQRVPISINAVTGTDIASANITNLNDIGQLVPGLQIHNEFGVATPLTFLRGIGNASFVTTSITPIGFYVDGVYIGQNVAQGLALFDIERIEVLRGPQGTLFGRNTTGGAINIITRKPSLGSGLEGEAKLTVGRFRTLNVDAALGGSLGDTAAFRLGFSRQSDDGAFRNVNPAFVARNGSEASDIDMNSVRGKLLWAPTENFSAVVSLHGGKSDGGNVISKPGFILGTPPTNCPPGAVSGAVLNGCSDPYGFGIRDSSATHETTEQTVSTEAVDAHGAAAELNWELGAHKLTSVTAWDSADLERLHDSDGHSLSFLTSTFLAETSYWSQEFRVTSNYAGAFNWVGGVYYYGDENSSFAHYQVGDLGGTGIAQVLDQKTGSYAAFADGTFRFAERWKLTAGLRWTSDKRDAAIQTWATNSSGVLGAPAAPPQFVPALSPYEKVSRAQAQAAFLAPLIPPERLVRTWKKWSGRVILGYDFDDTTMVYGSASRGFKGGEFNGAAIIVPSEVSLTDPEYLNSYEVGLKSTMLDGRLRANLAVFHMQYKNQQVQSFVNPDSPFPSLTNVGEAEINGAEFETQLRASDAWLFSFGGTWLPDAKFTKFFDPKVGDRSGNRLPQSPEWSLNALGRYERAISGSNVLSLQVQGRWNSERYFTVENRPGLREDAYAVVDARASLRFLDDRAEFGIFARNLLDKEYFASAYGLESFGGNVFQPGRPRVYGADFSYRFE
ncbi:MAG: TonB-dependent receptor [Steroidobacteraceae bacterium]|nr:TonB-dependent receptor [Steroidobacteraceae bacterium]